MTDAHPLDRPAWNALVTRWAPFAQGSARALQLAPQYGPFAGAADGSPESLAALAMLAPSTDGLWIVEPEPFAPPPGLAVRTSALVNQMTADHIAPGAGDFEVAPLTDADAPQMLDLARRTRPGPFASHTHRLGAFIGVKDGGKLVAMAGERMNPTGFTEVSGVCTDPDHRGRGYAKGLMRLVAERILARGETPFLHVYPGNTGAIQLYEALGFRLRRPVILTILDRD